MNNKLAEIAQREARKNYHGNTSAAIGNLHTLAELFEAEPEITLENLDNDWSGAFAFLCTDLAGVGLPIRYPDPRVGASFARVEAWEDYARLPKIRLWLDYTQTPEVGDLVIFEAREGKPPKMGVVLVVGEESMDVAVGNHHNHSAIIEHALGTGVRGYIRLENQR